LKTTVGIATQITAAPTTIHDFMTGGRLHAVTQDETPRGVAKIRTRADAPPIFHVVGEFEVCCVVSYVQYETAIGACYRLGYDVQLPVVLEGRGPIALRHPAPPNFSAQPPLPREAGKGD
jgi:hypothetical protein